MALSSISGAIQPPPQAVERMGVRLAAHYRVMPLRIEDDDTLVVATADPNAFDVLDELSLVLRCPVRAEEAPREAIADAMRDIYGVGADTLEALMSGRSTPEAVVTDDSEIDGVSSDASIIKFVNQLVVDAYNSRATDIHFEPFENRLRVRYRIDGILFEVSLPESIRYFRESIASRIKIMANLDIAERRLPQDGRIRVRIGGNDFDLRVSVIPIAHGESINIRILQRSHVLMGLEAIGFEGTDLQRLEVLLKKPHGIVLLTGPTGSGKTTTLYACLNRMNSADRKIITIEDPVEYQLEGICQMQVKAEIGFAFAAGLRSMLRHDPDVMMVGEIRDFETAELAIRCALTGHLVFSTLHTNDAAGAMPRLLDIGIEPFLLASSVEAVIAQRLVRVICPHCAVPHMPEREALAEIGADPTTEDLSGVRRGRGCELCRNSGYLGRTAIYELLAMDEEIRRLVMERSHGASLKRAALANGMRTLRANGWERVRTGITTVDEVLRVTQEDSSAKV